MALRIQRLVKNKQWTAAAVLLVRLAAAGFILLTFPCNLKLTASLLDARDLRDLDDFDPPSLRGTHTKEISADHAGLPSIGNSIHSKEISADHVDVPSGADNSPFPWHSNSDEEWFEDVFELLGCGKHKCAFSSKKHPETHGYVVSQSPNDVEILAYELSQKLSKDFGIRQLNAGPPRSFPCSNRKAKQFATDLSTTVQKASANSTANYHRNDIYPQKYWHCSSVAKSNLFLQPVKQLPKGLLMLKTGIKSVNKKLSYGGLERFAANLTNALSTEELQQFKEQMSADGDALMNMVKDNMCLVHDFQVLIDPWKGKIYHMDFDRCWHNVDHPREYRSLQGRIQEGLVKFTDALIEVHEKNAKARHQPQVVGNRTKSILR